MRCPPLLKNGRVVMARMVRQYLTEARYTFRQTQHLLCDFACTTIQVNRLVLVILAGADIRPAETSNASEGVSVRSRVSAPSHDGVVQQLAAELEALKAAMKSDKDKHHAELGALKSDKEKHHAEVEALKGKVSGIPYRSNIYDENSLLT